MIEEDFLLNDFRSVNKKKKNKPKVYSIEMRSRNSVTDKWRNWRIISNKYDSIKKRDQAVKDLNKGKGILSREYRAYEDK